MEYLGLIKEDASKANARKHLTQGKSMATTIRIPENLCDATKKFASLRNVGFVTMTCTSFIR